MESENSTLHGDGDGVKGFPHPQHRRHHSDWMGIKKPNSKHPQPREDNSKNLVVLALTAIPQQSKSNHRPSPALRNLGNTSKISQGESLNSYIKKKPREISGGSARNYTMKKRFAAACVYKTDDLSGAVKEQGKSLCGCAVVVEGGVPSIKKYHRKIMLKIKEESSPSSSSTSSLSSLTSVRLVWQGRIQKPSFGKFSVLHCSSEAVARKFFSDHGVSHYWDLANQI